MKISCKIVAVTLDKLMVIFLFLCLHLSTKDKVLFGFNITIEEHFNK